MPIFAPTITADMAKLVDVPDLGSGAARRVGSSPIIRTKKKLLKNLQKLFCFQNIFNLPHNIFMLHSENYSTNKKSCPIKFYMPPHPFLEFFCY